MTEREAVIALHLVDDLGPVRFRALVEAFGSAPAAWAASERDLRGVNGIGPRLAAAIARQRPGIDPDREQARAERFGARIVTCLDPGYPVALRNLHDPPLVLYAQGRLLPEDARAMAVVGSRRCTHYGRCAADRLAFQLARAGFTIVSGLARGIDWTAHEGALHAGGRTLAVLGSALDTLYPPEAAPLAERIAGQGAVLSEYALGREPDRTTFPYRNRIISGLSLGTIVVEADIGSGAMITAGQALEQGRSVFAVPGRIDSPASRGTHRLIKQGARLIEDLADIYEELEHLRPDGPDPAQADLPGFAGFSFGPEEERIVQALAGGETPDVDRLAREAGLPAHRLGALLVGLEMKRVVRLLPGRRVSLSVRLPDRGGAAAGAGGGPEDQPRTRSSHGF